MAGMPCRTGEEGCRLRELAIDEPVPAAHPSATLQLVAPSGALARKLVAMQPRIAIHTWQIQPVEHCRHLGHQSPPEPPSSPWVVH
eukprot:CAMPEP_0204258500 /NCGR_PEP_ID=MMETSP0468-20130131/5013_1 /ASSEMBLY_ACC=CAM_ASM_000383 /TAXON_ID=2969 /ORGANISM="Oxyrrhis marina" /LENGTH=85 /DNA_ID=CAMNT_0051232687 /DNA_START=507 /DNA_END=761 /DNA_ORIENTATION=+